MNCRACNNTSIELVHSFGEHPIANNLLESQNEKFESFPLDFFFCSRCGLYQVENVVPREKIFHDKYPYLTGTNHAYVEDQQKTYQRIQTEKMPNSILEFGCNDGSLLDCFKHCSIAGVEISRAPREIARSKGYYIYEACPPITSSNFNLGLAINVLGHNDELKTMVYNLDHTCYDIIIEQPFVGFLFQNDQFDTIYHEHFSYFQPSVFNDLFERNHLTKIEFSHWHGGTYRYFLEPEQDRDSIPAIKFHDGFSERIQLEMKYWKDRFDEWKFEGKKVLGYGAAAKGISFLNYCGIEKEHMAFCIDDTISKQGKFMPGSRIPIKYLGENDLNWADIIFILPWNFKHEITQKLRAQGFRGEIVSRL